MPQWISLPLSLNEPGIDEAILLKDRIGSIQFYWRLNGEPAVAFTKLRESTLIGIDSLAERLVGLNFELWHKQRPSLTLIDFLRDHDQKQS